MSSSTKTALCIQLKDKIELTDQEKKIFDKIIEGDDFCDMVNEYLYSLGENKRWVGVIKSNPEKCKHFTTGIMKLTRVRDAMKNKISKDRIGDEINLIVPGNRPVQAMMDVCGSAIFWVVFALCCLSIGFSSIHDTQRGIYMHSSLLLPIRGKGTGSANVGRLHRASEGFISLIPLLTESSNTGKAAGKESVENMCEIPLADGKEIMEMLGIKEGGKIVGRWKHELLVWQLADPTRTLEQSLDWMRGCLSKR
ncbi:hypothetical protein MKX03_015802 [Papaver bracteatum]|nr:hypothetical protein MKX03_015802 [Papaver bracteatum]